MAFLPQEEQHALVSSLSLDGVGPRAITHPDRLGEELQPQRDPSRTPLVQAMVVLQNATENQALERIEAAA